MMVLQMDERVFDYYTPTKRYAQCLLMCSIKELAYTRYQAARIWSTLQQCKPRRPSRTTPLRPRRSIASYTISAHPVPRVNRHSRQESLRFCTCAHPRFKAVSLANRIEGNEHSKYASLANKPTAATSAKGRRNMTVVAIAERARAYAHEACSSSTRRVYASDWHHFEVYAPMKYLAARPA